MVVNNWYGRAAYNALANNVTADANLTVALLADTYTPDRANHDSWADVSADEVTGSGYTSGGQSLSNISLSSATNITTLDADDVTWSNSTIDAEYAVVYDSTPGTATDQKLLFLVDFEGVESSQNGDFTISWHADGIGEIDAS